MREALLITGSSGQLGAYLLAESWPVEQPIVAWSGPSGDSASERADDGPRGGGQRGGGQAPGRGEPAGQRLRPVDLARPDEVAAAFRAARPERVVHLAAVSRVSTCRENPRLAERINVDATRLLVALAREWRARLLLASTDMVFDGRRGGYAEDDVAEPLSVYGRSKLAAERSVLDYEQGLVVRLSLLFGPSRNGRPNYFDAQCDALRQRRPLPLFTDEWRTPLSLPVAASVLRTLVLSDVTGLLHLGGPERLSRRQLGCKVAQALGVDESLVVADQAAHHAFAEPRPRDVSLDSRRIYRLFPDLPRPSCDEALRQLVQGRLSG